MDQKPHIIVEYPFPDIPTPGETIEVAPGIHWLRLPLPFVLDHINVYLLEDGDGWTVVDCGLNKDQVKEIWEVVFARLLGKQRVKRVIVTYFHPDHMGLCRWMIEHFDAELWMSNTEWLMSQFAFELHERNMEAMLAFWRSNGMSVATTDGMRGRGNFYAQNVGRPPIRFRRLAAGDGIEIAGRLWRVIIGEGHAPEHVCLACPEDDLLLSGDQILPRITTNISVQYSQPDADPLRLFLAANTRFAGLPPNTLTLCAHDRPFLRLHERLDQLREHHQVRLDAAWEACTTPKHAVDMLPVLFWRPLDLHQQSFAIGELIAHLHCLWYEGRLERILGDDGVYRFMRLE